MNDTKKDIRLLIITGLSGSGKSTVAKALEDMGFFCIDNLPVVLLPAVLDLLGQSKWDIKKIAVVMDVRERSLFSEFPQVFSQLHATGQDFTIIFLEANDDVLIRRYKETRRVHPLDADDPNKGIFKERKALSELKSIAHKVIDTSDFNPHQLRTKIFEFFTEESSKKELNVTLLSFGYRYGTPTDADIVMDVRFLPNPYFNEELKHLTGFDPAIVKFVLENRNTQKFLKKFSTLLDFLLPQYVKEGKSYLTVAVGCTGGIHRSVVITNEIAQRFKQDKNVSVNIVHRDVKQKTTDGVKPWSG
jgi:UPF0042 nucleotide-binding protein